MSFMSDSWIAWKPRIEDPSNIWPSVKKARVDARRGDVEVLHDARQVAESDVDELHVLVPDELHDLFGVAEHPSSSWPEPALRPRESRDGRLLRGCSIVSGTLRDARHVTSR
ncbi:hypothetical protein GCM10025868_42490 [Angustibacter aerolatus]|uniref:Uncharacterized protein n=1 Tax=Angustibacter aerolatus TaxID=1162965 RepID=A0ABQ6JPE7_9ACTN|nr:hypothetical protein GCM10025868_42490 [Angustibacter aerolatus]